MNLIERLIVRKDIESYLANHSAALQPILNKIMPFLRPSLLAWTESHSHELTGILCDCLVKHFDANSLTQPTT